MCESSSIDALNGCPGPRTNGDASESAPDRPNGPYPPIHVVGFVLRGRDTVVLELGQDSSIATALGMKFVDFRNSKDNLELFFFVKK